MKNFNLTEWALGHRALVLFLIIVVSIAGVAVCLAGPLMYPRHWAPVRYSSEYNLNAYRRCNHNVPSAKFATGRGVFSIDGPEFAGRGSENYAAGSCGRT